MIRRSLKVAISGVAVFALVGASTALAQTADQEFRSEIEALKSGQEQIRKDLAEIKNILPTRAPAQPAGPNVKDEVFALGSNPTQGEQTAKLTLVEFTDYQ